MHAASSRQCVGVSTHSRLKAAAIFAVHRFDDFLVSTHSRLKAAVAAVIGGGVFGSFQHTAA